MRAVSVAILCLLLSVRPGLADMVPERVFEAMRKNMPSEAKCTASRDNFKCDYGTKDGPYAMAYEMKTDGKSSVRNIDTSVSVPIQPTEMGASLDKMRSDFLADVGISLSQTQLCVDNAKKKLDPKGLGWLDGNYLIRCFWSDRGQAELIVVIENANARPSP